MRKQFVVGTLLSVTLVVLSGCPATRVESGDWLFTVSNNGEIVLLALNLHADGSTETPDPRPPDVGTFGGTVTWMQNESVFTLSQVFGINLPFIYTGTVDSSTSMYGTWTRGDSSGTWIAEKL